MMEEIRRGVVSVDRLLEEDNRCRPERPERPEESERCGEIRIEARTVNIHINCRS